MSNPYPPKSDEELVLAARHGSREAFDELVSRFRDAMLAVAQATGSREAAEDVVQDAFLQAFRALPQLQDPSRFGGWLSVITRYRARRVGAREGRCEPMEPAALDRLLSYRSEATRHPADECEKATERATIRSALARLPSEHEVILRLYYYEGWSVRRIASHLSIPLTTVKWRLHRGRRLLEQQLAMLLEIAPVARVFAPPPPLHPPRVRLPERAARPGAVSRRGASERRRRGLLLTSRAIERSPLQRSLRRRSRAPLNLDGDPGEQRLATRVEVPGWG